MKHTALKFLVGTLAVAVLGLITGCATPDLKPFATETAGLGGAIASEQAEIIAHFAQTTAKAEVRDSGDTRVKKLKDQQEKYEANALAVNAVMDVAVSYSTALADLAAAGENGSKAVDSLTDSLKGFSTALNIAFPIAGTAPAWAGNLAHEIAQDLTRIQAQKNLTSAAKVAAPTIDKIAQTITELYTWQNGSQAKIVAGLQANEEGILRDIVGQNRLAFYKGINVDKVSLPPQSEQTRLEYFFGDIDDRIAKQKATAGICGITSIESTHSASHGNKPALDIQADDPNCLTGQSVQSLQAVVSLLSGIEPQFSTYMTDLATSRKWLEQRKAASNMISGAAKSWAAEHGALLKRLDECGALNALHSGCGNLTFSNFKLAVNRVKTIANKGGL